MDSVTWVSVCPPTFSQRIGGRTCLAFSFPSRGVGKQKVVTEKCAQRGPAPRAREKRCPQEKMVVGVSAFSQPQLAHLDPT